MNFCLRFYWARCLHSLRFVFPVARIVSRLLLWYCRPGEPALLTADYLNLCYHSVMSDTQPEIPWQPTYRHHSYVLLTALKYAHSCPKKEQGQDILFENRQSDLSSPHPIFYSNVSWSNGYTRGTHSVSVMVTFFVLIRVKAITSPFPLFTPFDFLSDSVWYEWTGNYPSWRM